MKHLTRRYNEEIHTGALFDFYFGDLKWGTLDIETTGLDPTRTKFILGGLLDPADKTVHQFFAESRSEERETLERFVSIVSDLDAVVTYNGRHFDMPFINKRLAAFSAEPCVPYDLDLYLVVRGYSPIRKFVPNLKQKTVENYMGLWQDRADEISGAESVELYDRYEKTGDPSLKRKILLHNSDDVMQLTRLLKVISKTDFHRAMYSLGFPAGPLDVMRIDLDRDFLTVSGRQRRINIDYIGYSLGDFPVESRFDRAASRFRVRFPVIRDSGLAIADVSAAGLRCEDFDIYPSFGSGFLVIEEHGSVNHMATNHFIKAFLKKFIKTLTD